jgi:hypothetical protein
MGEGAGAELLACIGAIRNQLDAIDLLLRSIGGDKAQARVLSDLRDRTNDLENEVRKEEAK